MKLAVFSPVFGGMSLEDSLKFLSEHGVFSMELGCGGYPGKEHADAVSLINDNKKIQEMLDLFKKYNVEICALSTHGNAVHPNREIAKTFQEDFEATCRLAEKCKIDKIITFSGCPGDSPASMYPNWVTCAWPPDYEKVLKYQWEDVLLPYWHKAKKFAENCGVRQIALEMHPGFCVYNPETLLRLRQNIGDIIGANFDPSHLIWQGIDPSAALIKLNKAVQHFHAKDTALSPQNISVNGVLDTKPYSNELERSWIFRTVGYGRGDEAWKNILSTLSLIGYNGAVSIEHEDSLMTPLEGLSKAIKFLQDNMIKEPKPTNIFWA